jgi:choline kinase
MIIKLTKHQIVSLYNALTALDGPDKKKEQSDSEIIESPFKFKGAAIYALSKNLRKVRTAVIDIEKIRDKMFNDAKDKPEDKEISGDKMKKFVEEYNAFLDSDTEIDLHTVKLSDLDLDNNRVPIRVMEHLVDTIVVAD